MSNKETNNITYSLKNREKLIVSAYRGDIHRVEEHLDNGFPLDFPLNESGWTLLHIAAD